MKSTKVALAALLGAASLFAAQQKATAAPPDYDYTGWYVNGAAGWNKVQDSSITSATTLKWNDGWGLLGGGGYRFGHSFRVEGELSYRDNDLKRATGIPGSTSGELTNFGQMVNGLFDFDVAPRLTLSVGAGIGGVSNNYKISSSTGGTLVDDGNYSFGYQAIAGVNYAIAPHWQVYAEYHYMDATSTGSRAVSGVTYRPGDTNHLVAIGLRYFFGEPPPPPPPPPVAAPAPPPPPPPPPAPVPRNYLVFFDFDKSDITPEAHKIIVSAVEAAKKSNSLKITVTGHTDTVGTAKYNMALSLRRANAVKAELEKLGYSDHEIVVVGKGFTQPLVQTGPQVREPQNRRAEIVLE